MTVEHLLEAADACDQLNVERPSQGRLRLFCAVAEAAGTAILIRAFGNLARARRAADAAALELCIYCTTEPQDQAHEPYCSAICAIVAEVDR